MFYRIGTSEAVSLDPDSVIARITCTSMQWVTVFFRDGHSSDFHGEQYEQEYEAYKAFIECCPPLIEELEAVRLRKVRATHTHPESEELPRTLFAVFGSLPGSLGLELRLTFEGTGSLWTRGVPPECLFSFSDFQEGLMGLLKMARS